MKEQTIIKLTNRLKTVIADNISMNAYSEKIGLPTSYFCMKRKAVEQAKEAGTISDEDYNVIMDLFKQIDARPRLRATKKESTPDLFGNEVIFSDSELDSDDTSKVTIERDEEGKIVKYLFTIYVRDKQPILGSFNRDEMNMVYRLYSNYGSGITQREVSRFFPDYSLADFKRILRVFSITKASAPFAPHVIEENDKDKLLEMQFREKENDFLRSYEAEKIKHTESQLRRYMKENQDLKEQLQDMSGMLEGIDVSNLPKFVPTVKGREDRDLIIWLSDMHIGASVSGYSIYANDYDQVEVRLSKLVEQLKRESLMFGNFTNVIVCNLGDSLDGYDGQTTRGGHQLAQNMNNKEQLKCFIEVMTKFMTALVDELPCGGLSYYCVGESNHDGDFGYSANIALQYILQSMDIEATIFEKFIGEFTLGTTTYILCHGKDNKDMFKNLPLTLDVKTENFINEYIDNKGIKGNVVFVKGDLHQSATTYGRRFTYKSVGSLFGSSEWIHKNFGNTPAACDYSIVDENGNMLDGRIVLQ
jgi:hypothetical protein